MRLVSMHIEVGPTPDDLVVIVLVDRREAFRCKSSSRGYLLEEVTKWLEAHPDVFEFTRGYAS